MSLPDVLDGVFLAVLLRAIHLAPYSKVEESFNTQAVHDLLLAVNHADFDHLAFPGVVPRSFIGPLIIRMVALPAISLLNKLHQIEPAAFALSPIVYLYIARYSLAFLSAHSLRMIRISVSRVFTSSTAVLFTLICASQFHLSFWASRFIPNTWALIFVNYGVAAWIWSWKPVSAEERRTKMRERDRIFGGPPASLSSIKVKQKQRKDKKKIPENIDTSSSITPQLTTLIFSILFAAIVFRLELLAFLAPLLVLEVFYYKTYNFWYTAIMCIVTCLTAISVTVAIDTYFWTNPTSTNSTSYMWPEYHVYAFNIIQGRSKEYGISPPLAYFTSLLPRITTWAYPLSIYAYLTDHRARRLLHPALFFTSIMSCIGHKEWRFIMPIIPIINLSAAISFTNPPKPTKPTTLTRLLQFIPILLISASFIFSAIATQISSLNYPGGHALVRLHADIQEIPNHPPPSIHMDVYTCQTGVSRFLESYRDRGWIYDKAEDVVPSDDDGEHGTKKYTHLITATPNIYSSDVWNVVGAPVEGMVGVRVNFGDGGWQAWVGETMEKVLKGDLSVNVKEFVVGVRLPIEVMMESKVYLLERKGWRSGV